MTGFCWVAVRLGLAKLPQDVGWMHVAGAGWLAGIGFFTMSLFISQLAFSDPQFMEEAKLGILMASATSAAIGLSWLMWASTRRSSAESLRSA